MKISAILKFYAKWQEKLGDVDIHTELHDGRCTYVDTYTPTRIVKGKKGEWPKDREGKYFVKEY